ncbi:hypothetical protein J2T18_000789 [Paenibacillus polymyxa]|nr:hypothetical protein [Paenibacillus polymyxa]
MGGLCLIACGFRGRSKNAYATINGFNNGYKRIGVTKDCDLFWYCANYFFD